MHVWRWARLHDLEVEGRERAAQHHDGQVRQQAGRHAAGQPQPEPRQVHQLRAARTAGGRVSGAARAGPSDGLAGRPDGGSMSLVLMLT